MKFPPSGPLRKGCGKGRGAFSLVEVVIALGLVTFVLVAILGLFSVGLSGTRDSERSIDAANLATEIIEKRRAAPAAALPASSDGRAFVLPATPASLPASPSWVTAPSYVGAGGYAVSDERTDCYRLSYAYWQDANSAPATNSQLVRLSVVLSSPPRASLDKASTRYEVTTSYFQP